MPNIFRLTFFFQQQGTGWSESIHTTSATTVALQNLVTAYTGYRRPLMNSLCFLTDVRVSDDLVQRDIEFLVNGLPVQGADTTMPANPTTSCLIQMEATPIVRRFLYLRGLSNAAVFGRQISTASVFQANITAFTNWLTTQGTIAIKSKAPSPGAIQTIKSVDNLGNVITNGAVTGITPGSTVKILGVPVSVLPKRVYKVWTVSSTTSFLLQGWPTNYTLTNQGSLYLQVTQLLPVTYCVPREINERRTGRPFGVPRGRARNRA